MRTWTVTVASHGYEVSPPIVSDIELEYARRLVMRLLDRYRRGEEAVCSAGVNIADAGRRHPQRNPGVELEQWLHEPFIIGDLLAHELGFARFFAQQTLWDYVAELFNCAPSELLFHFSNLTRKPAEIGPAIGWHRDAENTYFASQDGRTIRLLIPLQHMSAQNGGTAVVPYSHLHANADSQTALCPEVPTGSCLALHSATLHGGTPNRSGLERDVIVLQFGLASSPLRCMAPEKLALATREELLAVYRESRKKENRPRLMGRN